MSDYRKKCDALPSFVSADGKWKRKPCDITYYEECLCSITESCIYFRNEHRNYSTFFNEVMGNGRY